MSTGTKKKGKSAEKKTKKKVVDSDDPIAELSKKEAKVDTSVLPNILFSLAKSTDSYKWNNIVDTTDTIRTIYLMWSNKKTRNVAMRQMVLTIQHPPKLLHELSDEVREIIYLNAMQVALPDQRVVRVEFQGSKEEFAKTKENTDLLYLNLGLLFGDTITKKNDEMFIVSNTSKTALLVYQGSFDASTDQLKGMADEIVAYGIKHKLLDNAVTKSSESDKTVAMDTTNGETQKVDAVLPNPVVSVESTTAVITATTVAAPIVTPVTASVAVPASLPVPITKSKMELEWEQRIQKEKDDKEALVKKKDKQDTKASSSVQPKTVELQPVTIQSVTTQPVAKAPVAKAPIATAPTVQSSKTAPVVAATKDNQKTNKTKNVSKTKPVDNDIEEAVSGVAALSIEPKTASASASAVSNNGVSTKQTSEKKLPEKKAPEKKAAEKKKEPKERPTFETTPDATIAALKRQIEDETGIDADEQRVVFRDVELDDDDKQVKDYIDDPSQLAELQVFRKSKTATSTSPSKSETNKKYTKKSPGFTESSRARSRSRSPKGKPRASATKTAKKSRVAKKKKVIADSDDDDDDDDS